MSENPTRDFYNQNAKAWGAEKNNSFYHEEEFRKFLTYLKPGDSVLDIGCANGIHVPLFLGLGRSLSYRGIDISDTFIAIAKERYPQLQFATADLLDADSLPRQKFDAFWAAAVFMHIPESEWPEMMANVESIMKPGAIGYITVPQERFSKKENDPRHFSIFSIESFTELIGLRGWKVLDRGHKGTTSTNDWLWFIVQLP